MQRPRVATSLIVRVIEQRDGTRIQVHAIGSREVQEFATWEAALSFVHRLSRERGLR